MVDIREIYQGDDTDFGDGSLAHVIIKKFRSFEVTKTEFRMGALFREFDLTNVEWEDAPGLNDYVQTTIKLDFNREETKLLHSCNSGYMALYDKDGKKRTAKGSLTVKAKNEVV